MKISFEKLLVGFLLAVFFLLNFFSAQKESLTYDEPVHLKAGVEEWQKRDFSLDTNNPPLIREIAVLPILLGAKPGRQYLPARLMVTAMGLILGLVIYHYGLLPALLLFVFEPTILAHSHYLTLDIGATLFFALAYFSFLNFLKKSSFNNALICGIFIGCSFSSKVTIIPALVLSFLIAAFLKRDTLKPIFYKKALAVVGIALLTIWAAYFFTLAPVIAERQDPTRLSEIIMIDYPLLSAPILWLKNTPVPLGFFLATLKNSLVFNLKPHPSFFLGSLYPKSRWYFLPVIFLLKTPIPLIILGGLGILGIIRENNKDRFYLIIPVLATTAVLCLSPIQPFLRYLLPIYPFLIMIGGIGAIRLIRRPWGKLTLLILLSWYVIGTLNIFPHFISYANGLAGSRNTRLFLFADSNYDWGQGLVEMKRYLEIKDIESVEFSYFGTDSPEAYGLVADRPFGEKFEERCPLYLIKVKEKGEKIIAISLSNYYYCGYYQKPEFSKDKVKEIVADSILIFK